MRQHISLTQPGAVKAFFQGEPLRNPDCTSGFLNFVKAFTSGHCHCLARHNLM